ncbi:MAG TPA: aldehyde dehydrogenase family protein [Candidatus Dojkabacteria bacterium]|nr:aldehyde dehydrogenase family protein [Candidatus Dojkabacteria bacterium]
MYEQKLLINNNWEASGNNKSISINSPWDNQPLGTVQAASQEQAGGAIANAADAFIKWRISNLSERLEIGKKTADLLKQNQTALSELLSKEIGKTIEDATSEISRSIDYLELTMAALKHLHGSVYHGDIFKKYPRGRKTGLYSRIPLGVVLAISPFNYPINLSVTKVIPALLSGNTVVFKPATQGSISSISFYQYFMHAGLPPGCLNIVTGESREIGDTLLTHPQVSLIAFTGSTEIGNHIRAVSKGIPLLLELGGKDVAIVTAKADLAVTGEQIIEGAFSYAGQRCTAQKLIIVFNEIADELLNKLVNKAKTLQLNPLINEAAAKYIDELVHDAVAKGCDVKLSTTRDRNYLTPGILDKITPEMRIFNEEQFGPVLPIVRVNSESEAVTQANSLKYGLQGAVFTQDIEEAFRIADKLAVGTVQINGKSDRGPDNFPFGGLKDSGQAMQGTIETIELMTRGKLTVLNLHKFSQ